MKISDPTQLALVLTFDPQTQARLDSVIAGLKAHGIAPFPEGMHVPAHITLAAFSLPANGADLPAGSASATALPSTQINDLQRLAAETAPLELRFDSLSAFNSAQGIIFLAPVMTRRLLELHQKVQTAVAADGLTPNPYYLPDLWVPHVTLAVEQPPEAIPVVFKACQLAGVFTSGFAEKMLLVEYPPPRQLFAFELGDHST